MRPHEGGFPASRPLEREKPGNHSRWIDLKAVTVSACDFVWMTLSETELAPFRRNSRRVGQGLLSSLLDGIVDTHRHQLPFKVILKCCSEESQL